MAHIFRKAVVAISLAAALSTGPSAAFAEKKVVKIKPAPSGHHNHHNNHRGRNVAVGIAAATAAAIILSQGARASRDDDDEISHREQCRRWDRRCDDGSEWACRKIRREC